MRRAVLFATVAILAVGWMRGISAKTRPEYPCAFKTETGRLVSLQDAKRAREKAVRVGESNGVRLNNVTRWNAERVIRCVAKAYSLDARNLVELAKCESGLNPGAVSPGGHLGLYQYLPSTWASASAAAGHAGASAYDGYANAHTTVQYVKAHGFGAWGSCYP